MRQPVAVVRMAERAGDHRGRVVGDVAAVRRQRQVEAEDAAVAVEADVVAHQERMAFAGGLHVVVARQPQLDRPPRPPGEHRGDAGDDGGLALLAAECAAHPADLDGDGVERHCEKVRDAVLHFGRMLRGAQHVESSIVARRGERDLALEIEVILAAAAHLAAEPVRRAGKRGGGVAAHDGLRRRHVGFARNGVFDGENGGQRLVVDRHEFCSSARLVQRRRRDSHHRLADILGYGRGKQRLVAADRRDVVLAQNVGRDDRRRDAGYGQRPADVDAQDARVRVRAQHQRDLERARHIRHVVDIERAPGDMGDGAVVTDRGVDAAADAGEGRVHSASRRVAVADVVSSCSRRTRFAAARSR